MLLQIQDGTLSIGAQTVLAHFDFEIRGNEKIAIVGRNGCGKDNTPSTSGGRTFP